MKTTDNGSNTNAQRLNIVTRAAARFRSLARTSAMSGSISALTHRLEDTPGKSDQSTLNAQYAKKTSSQGLLLNTCPHAIRRRTRTMKAMTMSTEMTKRSVG